MSLLGERAFNTVVVLCIVCLFVFSRCFMSIMELFECKVVNVLKNFIERVTISCSFIYWRALVASSITITCNLTDCLFCSFVSFDLQHVKA